jgi:3'-phosphoadenosine 5'-phosphosulfate sulfotransferase (PAPS reductase)/FAD synthetase
MISKKWQFLINAPFKISDECCNVMKKYPLDKYAKETGRHPIMGVMAVESNGRTRQYLEHGCIKLEEGKQKCMPMAFWLEADVWAYLKTHNVPYSSIYDMGYTRTGCMFCMFGAHLEKVDRFQLMAKTHPKIYRYCMDTLGMCEILAYIRK